MKFLCIRWALFRQLPLVVYKAINISKNVALTGNQFKNGGVFDLMISMPDFDT